MQREAVKHVPHSEYAYALDEETMVFRLRAAKGDLKACILHYVDKFMAEPYQFQTTPMALVATDTYFDYFEVEVKSKIVRFRYYFQLSDGRETLYYFNDNFYHTADYIDEFYQFTYLHRDEIAQVPAWFKRAVIYQIFPDSFATGPRYISGKERKVPNHLGAESFSYYGGTLRGIIDNLDYIQDLGADCLYLNPIFTAKTAHRYNIDDYYTIDPAVGDLATFKELVRQCHARGIRVILDVAFNHTGTHFFAFRDLLEKGENSPYKDWYYRVEFPIRMEEPNYACFGYHNELPKLNTAHSEVREYLLNVGTYWIREADIDGWRLDVADEVDHFFWKCFRRAIKAVKPDAVSLGETWGDAHPWLQGDEFDSVMNYRWSNLCKDFFALGRIDAAEFDGRLHALHMRYRKQHTYAQMNFLDTHDVARFLHVSGGDISRLKLAVVFLLTGLGVPSVYYGDEQGISNEREVILRPPMVWDGADRDGLFWHYKKLIALRKKLHAMVGDFKTWLVDAKKGLYGFIRQGGGERVWVLLNNSPSACDVNCSLDNGNWQGKVTDLLNEQAYAVAGSRLHLELPPFGAAVLVRS